MNIRAEHACVVLDRMSVPPRSSDFSLKKTAELLLLILVVVLVVIFFFFVKERETGSVSKTYNFVYDILCMSMRQNHAIDCMYLPEKKLCSNEVRNAQKIA